MQVTTAPEVDDEPRPSSNGGGRYRGRYSSRSSPWWRWGFPVCLTLLVVAAPVLVLVGMRVVLGSSDGRLIRTIDDPAAPGWQAIVEPTPIHGLALVDSQGALDSVSVLILSGEGAGAVIEIPGSTIVATGPASEGAPAAQAQLSTIFAQEGIDALGSATERLLGVGLGGIDEIRPPRWGDLVTPVGTLRVDNPDSVTGFPVGQVDLAPSKVWEYLSAQDSDESDLARLARREAFWTAWLGAVSNDLSRPGVVPGEVDVGVGKFVRALAAGNVGFAVLPVTSALDSLDSTAETHMPMGEEIAALVARFVPFPSGPEGARLRSVVLDGTGKLDHGVGAAIVIGKVGAQVDKVGNHTDFDVATTQIVYYDPASRARAELLREALGVGELVLIEEPGSAIGATVILGRDYLDGLGR